jgi:tetratricopeptide (TPR) repeat protein
MKKIFLIFLAGILYLSNAIGQNTDYNSIADSLSKVSGKFYDTDPKKFIELRSSAAILFKKGGNKTWEALSYQNIAFVYEEKLNKIDSAIFYVNKAIPIWTEIKDYKGLANILKYLGMLEGKIGNFSDAKTSIKKAIDLFNAEGLEAGVAVSYFDLALVFENENKLDSCLFFLNKNKAYFDMNSDTLRIFNTNNKIFEIYLKQQNYKEAKIYQESNTKLEKSEKVFWQHLLDFYKLNIQYFDIINDKEKSKMYSDKQKILRDDLTSKGVIFK